MNNLTQYPPYQDWERSWIGRARASQIYRLQTEEEWLAENSIQPCECGDTMEVTRLNLQSGTGVYQCLNCGRTSVVLINQRWIPKRRFDHLSE